MVTYIEIRVFEKINNNYHKTLLEYEKNYQGCNFIHDNAVN